MLFSQTVEYALRAVVDLAQNPDAQRTSKQIAKDMQVPLDYLSKVLQGLARAGIVQSHRGIKGGFTLARPAREITILQVVNAVDPIKRIYTCPLGLKAHENALCPLHKRLDEATAAVEATLADTTLAQVIETTAPAHPAAQPLTISATPGRSTRQPKSR